MQWYRGEEEKQKPLCFDSGYNLSKYSNIFNLMLEGKKSKFIIIEAIKIS
jgi:hypothetical protein